MKFSPARLGGVLKVKGRKILFSFWPMGKGKKREKLHSTLFVTDPWVVIEQSIKQVKDAPARKQSLACLWQSRDFFRAAQNSEIQAAKPLLLYYCFLNLAKSFIIFTAKKKIDGRFHHGLRSQDMGSTESFKGTIGYVGNKDNSKISVFQHFSDALYQDQVKPPKYSGDIYASDFLSQILVGHRVYCQATGGRESFVSLNEVHFKQDKANSSIWLLARASRHDFFRLDHKLSDFADSLSHSELKWVNVNKQNTNYGKSYAFAEMKEPVSYRQKPSHVLNDLCQKASRRLWRTVTSYPPYRKYYIYIPRGDEQLVHQLLSIYLATFYFGSITRYKPEEFGKMLNGATGGIHTRVFQQPAQTIPLLNGL